MSDSTWWIIEVQGDAVFEAVRDSEGVWAVWVVGSVPSGDRVPIRPRLGVPLYGTSLTTDEGARFQLWQGETLCYESGYVMRSFEPQPARHERAAHS